MTDPGDYYAHKDEERQAASARLEAARLAYETAVRIDSDPRVVAELERAVRRAEQRYEADCYLGD
jgi:hypothetical protein